MADPAFTEFEQGERFALLGLRAFISEQGLRMKGKRLIDEIQLFCATRLGDIRADAEHRETNGPQVAEGDRANQR